MHSQISSKIYVKICGITKPDQAIAIAKLGADCLGYICVAASPRFVSCEQLVEITKAFTDLNQSSKIDHVGVFLDATIDRISNYIHKAKINSIQLHGNESPEFCQQIRLEFPKIKLIKAFRVKNSQTLERVYAFTNYVDVVLLDAYDPQFAGGTGKTIDWSILKEFRENFSENFREDFSQTYKPRCDWWLAGGLSPQNVKQAIAQLKPDGIDVSSGVEKSVGDKDLEQVKNLLDIAKSVPSF